MIIYKYKLNQDPLRYQDIEIPGEIIPLHVGEQYGELYVWCMVTHPRATPIKHRFYILATGHEARHIELGDLNIMRHIGTCQMNSGLVWHVFYA